MPAPTLMYNERHMDNLASTICSNVNKYFKDLVKSDADPVVPADNSLRAQFAADLETRIRANSFATKFEKGLDTERRIFNSNQTCDSSLLDSRSFSRSPEEYKEAFKECNYVSLGFKNKNNSITYPYYKIPADTLMEKMKNIKDFVDENIAKRNSPETERQAIMDLAQLTDTKYTFTVLQGNNKNSFLLGTRSKTMLLYHSHPDYYPIMTNNDLFSLFMLTDSEIAKPDPSKCEFVTYNRIGNWIEINKEYPYDLFTFYANYIHARIKHNMNTLPTPHALDLDSNKFVVVEAFLKLVYEYNSNYLERVRTVPSFKNSK